MKLHLGCGPIYLKGYVNVDVKAHFFAHNAPKDIFQKNLTTFDNYYKHEFGKATKLTIVDVCSDILELPYSSNSIDQVVLIHVLEHLPVYKSGDLLKTIYNILKPNGQFIVAVPDVKETAKLLTESKNTQEEDFYIRLIHGTQRNQYSHHYCGFVERTFKDLLKQYGFCNFEVLPNINFYPAIHIKAFKGEKNENKSK